MTVPISELQEGHGFRPRVLPEPDDRWVAFLPLAGELGEPVQRVGLGRRGVDGLEPLAASAQPLFEAYLNEFLSKRTMQVCPIVVSQTALTASGRPSRPSQTSRHTSRTPRLLISAQHPQPELGTLAVLAGPQTQDVALGVHGDAQRQVDGTGWRPGPPDLDVNGVREDHRIHRSSGRLCQSAIPPSPAR